MYSTQQVLSLLLLFLNGISALPNEEVWKNCVWTLELEEETKMIYVTGADRSGNSSESLTWTKWREIPIHSMNHPAIENDSDDDDDAANSVLCVQMLWKCTLPNMLIGWFRVIWNFLKAIECLDNKDKK